MGHASVDVEAAKDVELVADDGEAARQDCATGVARPVVCRRHGCDGIGPGVIAEYTGRCGRPPRLRAADAVNLRGRADGEYAAGHVAHLSVGVGGRLGRPGIVTQIVLQRVSGVAAGGITAPPTHDEDITVTVSWEEDGGGADQRGWEVGTARPGINRIRFACFACAALRQPGHHKNKKDEQTERKRGRK